MRPAPAPCATRSRPHCLRCCRQASLFALLPPEPVALGGARQGGRQSSMNSPVGTAACPANEPGCSRRRREGQRSGRRRGRWLSWPARAPQAMYSAKSKVNACTGDPDWPLDVYRFQPPMGFETAGRLSEDRWRKSHQWCAQGNLLALACPVACRVCALHGGGRHAAYHPFRTGSVVLQRARARAACHSLACMLWCAAHTMPACCGVRRTYCWRGRRQS